jgi:GDP-D-mannose dehydratase
VLGWEPTYTFQELIKEMVAADLAAQTEKAQIVSADV